MIAVNKDTKKARSGFHRAFFRRTSRVLFHRGGFELFLAEHEVLRLDLHMAAKAAARHFIVIL